VEVGRDTPVIPSPDEIRALHKEIAPSADAFETVYTHCEIVWEVASQLLQADDLPLDAELLRAGCLLHDIGVHLLDGAHGEHYIRHGILGEQLLRSRGFPEAVARFCGHHTGVGLTRDDVVRQALPLPVTDYLAETGEERLLMYADKFHSKSTPPVFVTAPAYRKRVSVFGAGHVARFAEMVREYGEPDLAELAGRYGHDVI
jgi:uncharacterized protein